MCGQEGYFGTSAFSCVLDIDALSTIKAEAQSLIEPEKIIEEAFMGANQSANPCSIKNLTIPTNAQNIIQTNMGDVTDEVLF